MASHGIPRVSEANTRDDTKEKRKIDEYQSLVELVNAKIAAKELTKDVLGLTSKLLSKNPEYYTIWNHRRLILLHQFTLPSVEVTTTSDAEAKLSQKQQIILDLLTGDLRLLVQLLVQFPKCYWIWNYRQWLLEQAETHLPKSITTQLWQQELGLVGKMLARDERNFHGWSYRRTIVANLEQLREKSMAEEEYEYTTRMIQSGLKNFSAWHNRSKLIPRFLSERHADEAERRKLLDDELELIQTALTDPFNQSAWDYHAFLIGTFTPGSLVNGQIVRNFTDHDRIEYLKRELDRIKEMLEVDDDCKLIYQALIDYSALFLQFEGENNYVSNKELREWLQQLRTLDKLRSGRWDDIEAKMRL